MPQPARKLRMSKKRNKLNRTTLFAGVFLIILLIALIIVVGAVKKKRARLEEESLSLVHESESIEASINASIEASIAESLAEMQRISLTESTNPEVTELINRYFEYRLSADAAGLNTLYGRPDAKIDDELLSKLTAQQSWIRSYDDIKCYVIPGLSDGELAGVCRYRVNFRRVNTKAPGIMYFYMKTGDDGKWQLCDNLMKDVRDYLDTAFEETGVNAMVDENTQELRALLAEDSDLALMYQSFMNGEIYSDYNLDYEREQQVDLFLNPEDSVLITE